MTHPAPDRAAEMLAEVAELDLALARRLHAAAMAADDNAELAELTRAYQRATRSMRQSLALGARLSAIRARAELARVQAERARAEAAHAEADRPRKPDPVALRRRARELEDAVGRVVARFTEDETERESLFGYLDRFLDTLEPTGAFTPQTLDEQVEEFCDEFDIPPQLYARWRELPPLEPAAPAPEPADSG